MNTAADIPAGSIGEGKFNWSLVIGAAGMLCGALLNLFRAVSWLELAPGFTEDPAMATFNEFLYIAFLGGGGFGLLGLGVHYAKNLFTWLGIIALMLVADLYFLGLIDAISNILLSAGIGTFIIDFAGPGFFSAFLYGILRLLEIVWITLLYREFRPQAVFLGFGGVLFLLLLLGWALGSLRVELAGDVIAVLLALVMAGFYGFTIYRGRFADRNRTTTPPPVVGQYPYAGGAPPQA